MLKNNQPLKGIASVKTLLFVLSLLLLVQMDFEGGQSSLFANVTSVFPYESSVLAYLPCV